MAEDLIDKIIDREAIKSDVDFVTKSVNQIADLIKQMKNVQGATGTAKTPTELNANIAKNTDLEKQYQQALKQTQDALNKKAAAAKQLTLEDAKAQEQLKKTNAEIRQQAKEAIAAENSIEKLRAKLAIINAQKNKLDINTEEYKNAEADVLSLNNKIKELEQGAGDFRRNVGNYAGSLSPALNGLKAEFAKVQAEVAGLKATDPGFAKKKAEADLLESVINGLDTAFGSTKAEMKAFTEAAKQLGLEFGKTNETFLQFVNDVGEQKDALADIQNAINFKSSDTKYLDGIVNSINVVVGAYGAWQSATVLLGDENEELQKSMQKLQAVLTFVQSAQSIVNGLQSDGAAIQTVLAAKTWLTNTAKTVETAILGTSTTAMAANVAVNEAGVIASEASAAATALTTVAMEGSALAAGEATIATIGFKTALISTGIGAIIIALIYGITKLVGAISDWAHADERAIENQTKLAQTLKELIDIEKKITTIRTNSSKQRISQMEAENEKNKALGVNQVKTFAMDKQIAAEKKKVSDAEAARAKVDDKAVQDANRSLANATLAYRSLIKVKQQYEQQQKAAGKTIEDSEDYKRAEANAKATLDLAQANYDNKIGILEEQKNSNKEYAIIENQEAKFNADELRRLSVETARIQANAVMDKNAIILGDERSTLEQRLAAMKSNAEQQKIIAKAELTNIQNDPTQSSTSKAIAEKTYTAEIAKIQRSSSEEIRKLKGDYRKRDLAADLDIKKTLINQDAEAKKKIVENESATLEERLNASAAYVEDQKKLVDAEFQFKKETSVLTDKELQALEADHNAKLVAIVADGEKQKLDVLESAGKRKQLINKKFNDFILSTTEADVKRIQQYSADVQALNKSLQNKKISQEKYEQELLALTDKYNVETVQAELNKQKKLIEIGNLTPDEKRQALIKLAELEKQLSDASLKTSNDNEAKKRVELMKTLDYAKQLFDGLGSSLQSILGSNIERQKQGIQEQIDGLDKQKEAAIAAANAEAISTGEKADKIAIINANAQAKKEALERRQRELDNKKAKADRAFQVFNIIGSTAMAVMSALAQNPPNVAQAVISGVVGAAQLAAVLAAPIPKYKYGTESHKGGAAIVGDGGVNEVAIEPGKAPFITPNKPTLMNLKRGTKVYSSIDKYMAAMQNATMMSTLENGGKSVSSQTLDKALINSLESKLNETNDELRSVINAISNIPGVTVNNTWEGSKTKIDRKGSHELWVNDFVKG